LARNIAIVCLAALFLAFFVIYMINESYASQFEYQNLSKWEKRFYSQKFDPDQKKIFLFGSSHSVRADVFHIDKSLKEQGHDYDVYNLSHRGSQPATRVNSIDLIIEAKPNFVFYGLEFLSFWPHPAPHLPVMRNIVDGDSNSLLPRPQDLIKEYFDTSAISDIDFGNFKNPKLTTLKIFDVLRGETKFQYQGGKQPFTPYGHNRIMNYEELLKNVEAFPFLHYVDVKSKHIDAMEIMIKKFQENNIPVVLFTTQHHKLYLETVSDKDKKNYFLIIDKLEKKFGIKHFDFHDKYSDLETWANGDHLSLISEGSIMFSDDILEIIKKEIEQ
jgi:hypothetical protein